MRTVATVIMTLVMALAAIGLAVAAPGRGDDAARASDVQHPKTVFAGHPADFAAVSVGKLATGERRAFLFAATLPNGGGGRQPLPGLVAQPRVPVARDRGSRRDADACPQA
jgi:hypothetical protein